MKKILSILLVLAFSLLIIGCAPTTEEIIVVEETEEVIEEPIEDELVEEIKEEESMEEEVVEESAETYTLPLYRLMESETREILGRTVTIVDMRQPADVEVTVDGQTRTVKNTKEEEIIGDLRIFTEEFDFIYDEADNFVTLNIVPLDLGSNEYILEKGFKVIVGDKEILLEESKSNSFIYVTVYDLGTSQGAIDQKVGLGDTVTLNGLDITNLESYYKGDQYALIKAE